MNWGKMSQEYEYYIFSYLLISLFRINYLKDASWLNLGNISVTHVYGLSGCGRYDWASNDVGVAFGEDQSLAFAVNLSNPQESNIQPIESLPLLESTSNAENGTPQQARREWWRPLAAIALFVLTIEWLVYNRATLSKLRTQLMQTAKREA